MNKPDYTKLDSAIIEAIRGGKHDFTSLGSVVRAISEPIAQQSPGRYGPEPWRIVDRRLQALRKAGKIAYTRSAGWRLVADAS